MNLMGLGYERLLQLQQNRSKATMWKLYELQVFSMCKKVPRGFKQIDSCVLHVTTPQPLQITPALQEARLWDLL